MSEGGYKKNVGMIGSISLLVTSITGPGIVLIPLIYQQAGWLFPTIAFLVIGILAGLASLFIVESCNRFPGNEDFERNVEFTVMVHQFYGRRVYYFFIFILYWSLQSVNIASIIGSAQIFDSVLVGLVGGTCGWGISPINGLYCVTNVQNTNSPFGDNYMVTSFGFLIVLGTIIPLTVVDLNDNMFLQLLSLVYNAAYVVTLIISVAVKTTGLTEIYVSGANYSQVIGQVLFNFALANTVPSWMNVKHPNVDPKKCIWYSIAIALALYIITGFVGGVGYPLNSNTNLLQAMYADHTLTPAATGWITFIYILFPILTYITSVPVAMIVVRLNLLAAKICTPSQATWWAVYLPFLISIPMQTGKVITYFGTYTSIIFQSTCNFFAPFLIFLFLSRRQMEMAQSVLDELEFLDISAGIKKGYTEDDDFDYIYHLPYISPDRIVFRDPFKATTMPSKKKKKEMASMDKLSMNSRHSIRDIRGMLDPSILQQKSISKKRSVRSVRALSGSGYLTASGHANPGSIQDFLNQGALEGTRNSTAGLEGRTDTKSSALVSTYSSGRGSFALPSSGKDGDYDVGGNSDDQQDLIDVMDGGGPMFRAMPDIVYRFIHPNWVALMGLLVMVAMIAQVIVGLFATSA